MTAQLCFGYAERELAANASPDAEWNAAGLATLARFGEHMRRGSMRGFDFDAEHRAEYERRKAAKEASSDAGG